MNVIPAAWLHPKHPQMVHQCNGCPRLTYCVTGHHAPFCPPCQERWAAAVTAKDLYAMGAVFAGGLP